MSSANWWTMNITDYTWNSRMISSKISGQILWRLIHLAFLKFQTVSISLLTMALWHMDTFSGAKGQWFRDFVLFC